MSMDARIMATLPSHPKTRKLIKRYGQASAWNLICLFLFACANKSDGVLSGMTAEDIELACDWQGDDGSFILALVEIGFLDHDGQTYSIHDWATHNPWVASAKARSESAKQNASKRWAKSGNGNAESSQLDATGINPHCGSHDSALRLVETGNAPSPSPSPSPIPNPSPDQNQKPKRAAPIALPDCIPVDVWEMWDRYRNNKKGWTADAKALSLRTLTSLVAKGHDPKHIVETSIERGWTGLFEPKTQPNGQAKPVDTWAGRDI
jgi:hypothetical protein